MLFIKSAARLLVASSLLASLCAFQFGFNSYETRELPAFTSVRLATQATVIVHQGTLQRVEVEATPDDLHKLQTDVVDDQLRIYAKLTSTRVGPFTFNVRRVTLASPVTVHVTLPIVHGLTVSGPGCLEADSVESQRLWLGVSGSGQLQLGRVWAGRVRASLTSSGSLSIGQLHADTLRAVLSGSGGMTAAGVSGYSSLGINSSGCIDTRSLIVAACQARLSGSGSCQVNVVRTLEVHLSGSGSIVVSGQPQITSRASGNGQLRRVL